MLVMTRFCTSASFGAGAHVHPQREAHGAAHRRQPLRVVGGDAGVLVGGVGEHFHLRGRIARTRLHRGGGDARDVEVAPGVGDGDRLVVGVVAQRAAFHPAGRRRGGCGEIIRRPAAIEDSRGGPLFVRVVYRKPMLVIYNFKYNWIRRNYQLL